MNRESYNFSLKEAMTKKKRTRKVKIKTTTINKQKIISKIGKVDLSKIENHKTLE